MDAGLLIEQLTLNGDRIRGLVEGVSSRQAHWKPDPETWSIVEVINHLYDEERLDFRVRLELILRAPGQAWPPIDPPGWVTARAYNERDLEASIQNFLVERSASLDWLRGLGDVDWDAGVDAPWGGRITAGDMFSAWAAHDLLHMRQLVELQRAYLVAAAQPYQVDYAGPW
jgi:hypothetical protein